jgi:hypothetical protein
MTTTTRDHIIDMMTARAIEIGQDSDSGPYYLAWPSDSDINRDTQPGDYDYIIQPAIDAGLDNDDASEIFLSEKLHREICRSAVAAHAECENDGCDEEG